MNQAALPSSDNGTEPKRRSETPITEHETSNPDPKTSETAPEVPDPGPGTVKKGRGRPRKHPSPLPLEADSKIAKGRSKTGCITCRRRRKKCDETKPYCLNCGKNNVYCEGYPERLIWKSGKEKAEEARAARRLIQPRELPILIDGVETDLDRVFLDHYSLYVSEVDSRQNSFFEKTLLPMAMRHKGLMNSLLYLSSSHLSHDRYNYHLSSAIDNLRKELNSKALDTSSDYNIVAATLVLVLCFLDAERFKGEHKSLVDEARALLDSGPQTSLAELVCEIFVDHDQQCKATSINQHSLPLTEDFTLPQFIIQPEAVAYLGRTNEVFGCISRITRMRDEIRLRKARNDGPLIGYSTLIDAITIDLGIHNWAPVQQPGTEASIATQLYWHCAWIYLYCTIYDSRPAPKISEAVNEGFEYFRQLDPTPLNQNITLMPLFILGCATSNEEQRKEIESAFGTLKRYYRLRDMEQPRTVVKKVWQLMDNNESSWDWEMITKDNGNNFLLA